MRAVMISCLSRFAFALIDGEQTTKTRGYTYTRSWLCMQEEAFHMYNR